MNKTIKKSKKKDSDILISKESVEFQSTDLNEVMSNVEENLDILINGMLLEVEIPVFSIYNFIFSCNNLDLDALQNKGYLQYS